MTSDDILRVLRERRAELQRLGARRLGLSGSFMRGEERPDSAVDLLVELDRRTFDRHMDLRLSLEQLLGCPVDLVLAERLKPALRDRILSTVIDAA